MKKEYFMPTLEIQLYSVCNFIIMSGDGDNHSDDIWGEGGLDLI